MEFGLSGGDMGSNDDYDPDYSDPDSSLSPIERLEKCMENEHTFSRQLAARSLLETFHQVDDYSDAQRVVKALLVLANDQDGVVRTELSEQLAQVGKFCQANPRLFCAGSCPEDPFKTHILPVVLRFMVDINNQVRKTSQTALVDLVEQKLVETDQVISQVGPIVSRLADFDSSDDYRSEGATLICKLAPIVGPEIMDQLFLEHFLNLCTDPIFQIRKVCAVNFGTICQVMGRERTESMLLEKFFRLCGDSIWGVRKACTECFMQVSLVCSASVRHSHLSRAFINLVSDQSRWVRMAAFETLGAFISTFADPSTTGLRLTDDGSLILSEPSAIPETLRKNGELLHIEDVTDISIFRDASSLNAVPHSSTSAIHSMHLPPIPTTKSRELDILRSPTHLASELLDGSTGTTFGFIEGRKLSTTLSDTLLQGFSYANENVHLDISGLVETQRPEWNSKEMGKEIEKDTVANDIGPTQNDFISSEHHSAGFKSKECLSENNDLLLKNRFGDNEALGDSNDKEKSQGTEGKQEAAVLGSAGSISVQQLDLALENNNGNNVESSTEKEVSEFGSSNFWRRLVPEFESASCPEVISDDVVKRCVESCLVVDASTNCDDSCSSVSSKLRDSVSHLCMEAAEMKSQIEGSSCLEFGVIEDGPIKGAVIENSLLEHSVVVDDTQTPESKQVEAVVENSSSAGQTEIFEGRDILGNLAVDSTSSFSNVNSFSDIGKDETPMECDDVVEKDLQHLEKEIESEGKGRSSILINDSETEEIPLDDDSCIPTDESAVEKTFHSLLEMLDVSSEGENSPMDVGEENSLESNVEVDEEEVRELVAAAKDLPCDDIAIYEQSVVPRDLLEQYLSMMDPSCAQKVDGEITRHCAYSLPAVAYTLGRKNWPSLKNLYMTLAADVQWKVRRTLAFSIHELAMIVGEEITSRDLVPVFDGFLNDLDEVRIGVLKHLADFLKLLSVEARRNYLMKITDLLKTDNSRNWRFREELARQLYLLLDLFTATDVYEHIRPIALRLSEDRVALVRLAALRVLSRIMKRLAEVEESGGEGRKMWLSYLAEINEQFAQSSSCTKRQMYVHMCNYILQDQSTTEESFAEEFLPILILLHRDAIPNVRLTLARTFSQHIMHSEFFTSSRNPHYTELMQTVAALQDDRDRDVRFLIDQKPIEVSSSAVDVMS